MSGDIVKFETVGFKDLLENLSNLEKLSTKKSALRRGMKNAAQIMADAAAAAAPVAKDGDIKRGVGVSEKLTKRGRKVGDQSPEKKFRVNMYVGVDDSIAPESALLEFGTQDRTQKTTGRHTGKVTPHPYMRPAFNGTVEDVLALLAEECGKEVQKSIKRAANRAAKNGGS